MSLFMISYDVRSTNHEYQPLYDQLANWGASHLQNSVWLADLDGTPSAVRDALETHMHTDDTICVIGLRKGSGWGTRHARKAGNDWLKANF